MHFFINLILIFQFIIIYETPLILAAKNGHTKIIDHLLSQPNIDVNCKDVLISKALIKFKSNNFDYIS